MTCDRAIEFIRGLLFIVVDVVVLATLAMFLLRFRDGDGVKSGASLGGDAKFDFVATSF